MSEIKVGSIVRVYCDPERTELGDFLDGWERFKVEAVFKEESGTVYELYWLCPENPDVEPEVSMVFTPEGKWRCWNSADVGGFDPVDCLVEIEKEQVE